MKKKNAIVVITLLAVVCTAAVAFGVVTRLKLDDQDRYISSNYRHAFAELVSGVSDLDCALQKSLLVTSPSMAGAACTEVYGTVETAKMALGILPYSSTELEKTAGFIGRVGDYAYALSRKAATGEAFTREERDNLRALSETAALLAQNLNEIQDEMGSGFGGADRYAKTIKAFGEKAGGMLPRTPGDGLNTVEQEFPEVPTLIYDGPFSKHIEGMKPAMLGGQAEIGESDGRQAAAKFLGVRPEKVYPTGTLSGDIESFSYETELKGSVTRITVSRQGGVVYQVIGARPVEQAKLSTAEALDAARTFLERKGYANMRERYYMINNNVMTANFAYEDHGVICYPDLIKVGIALDDGSLQGFEAIGYVKAHRQRELQAPAVSEEQAKSKTPEDVRILGVGRTIIPSAGKNELFCYEFECRDTNEQRCLIYVNAMTGEQERIFILLEDENGTLTV
ncbi:MAG: germination protein YpeB [Oscillospiraceae bacterium]|jgi:germination protein YpeB|nr:germination protein YpeB [Oscillospiraceae bacterium]